MGEIVTALGKPPRPDFAPPADRGGEAKKPPLGLVDKQDKPTALGKWLVEVHRASDGFEIGDKVSKLDGEINAARRTVDAVWDVSPGEQKNLKWVQEGSFGRDLPEGKAGHLGLSEQELGYLEQGMIEALGVIDVNLGGESFRSVIPEPAILEYVKDVAALSLVLSRDVVKYKADLGDFLMDLGMAQHLRIVGDRSRQDELQRLLIRSSFVDESMNRASAEAVVLGWSASEWMDQRIDRLVKSEPQYNFNKNQRKLYSSEVMATLRAKINISSCAGLVGDRGHFTSLAGSDTQLALQGIKGHIPELEEKVSKEQAEKERSKQGVTAEAGGKTPASQLLKQVAEVRATIENGGKDVQAEIKSLQAQLEQAVGRLGKFDELGGQLRSAESDLQQAQKAEIQAAELKAARQNLLGDLDDEAAKLLTLDETGFADITAVQLLDGSFPVLEQLYKLDPQKSQSYRTQLNGLITAVTGGLNFNSIKTVIDGVLTNLRYAIGEESLKTGQQKLTEVLKSPSESGLSTERVSQIQEILQNAVPLIKK